MPRTDTAAREVTADPSRVYAAFVDPDALLRWLPPRDMVGRFEHFECRAGGSYRLVLTYDAVGGAAGKAGDGTDIVDARFVELVPNERVVQEIDFTSDDPAFAGTMRMTWSIEPSPTGSHVKIRAEQVPPGISAAEHAVGLASSLGNLAAYLDH